MPTKSPASSKNTEVGLPPLSGECLQQLREAAGEENLFSERAHCWPYGGDNSKRHACPQAVAFAVSHDQVQALVRACKNFQLPLIARGRGTGTTGATVPDQGGLVLSFERMNQILEIDANNRTARVEPGVINADLQQALAKQGFFWPPDPSSAAYCSIGGNLAYNSAGPLAVKYGTPRENTLGLCAITGKGETLITGTRTTKGVVGYDLTRLLIGSEGTLAIITEATLKLTPIAKAKRTLQALYRDTTSATTAVSRLMAQPNTPCALEFMDRSALDLVRNAIETELPSETGALLMIEIDGMASCLDETLIGIQQAATNEGLLALEVAKDGAASQALWATRKALSPTLRSIAPNKINEDVVVPVSAIPQLTSGLESLSELHQTHIVNFGHAGNGNLHVNLLFDASDKAAAQRAQHCLDAVFDLTLKLGGTLSGEHGVGLAKRDYVDREIAPSTLMLMRQLKQLFDPTGILNPGKGLPPA